MQTDTEDTQNSLLLPFVPAQVRQMLDPPAGSEPAGG